MFDGVKPDPRDTLKRASGLTSDYNSCFWGGITNTDELISNRTGNSQPILWRRPSTGTVKINCDAAFNNQSTKAGVVAIARNHLGAVVDYVNVRINLQSIQMAEAEAIRLVV